MYQSPPPAIVDRSRVVGAPPIGGHFYEGQAAQNETELGSKMLQIQSKRFYIDVKQNRRGRFVKVAEIAADGRRTQVYLALSTAAEFRDHLSAFSEFYSGLGPPSTDNCPEDGKLKSEMMVKDNRRYYLDLKENTRGRFLRVSQTIPRGGPRSQVAIPAQGLIEFRDALTDLLDEFGSDDGGFKGELPEGKHMRVENKNFYFDIGQNDRGIYMRISEVKTNFRTSVTVPEKSWSRFRDIFGEYVEKMAAAEAAAADVAGSASSGAAATSAAASNGAVSSSNGAVAASNGAAAAAGAALASASVSHGAVAATSLGLASPAATTLAPTAPSIEQTTGDPGVDQLATSN